MIITEINLSDEFKSEALDDRIFVTIYLRPEATFTTFIDIKATCWLDELEFQVIEVDDHQRYGRVIPVYGILNGQYYDYLVDDLEEMANVVAVQPNGDNAEKYKKAEFGNFPPEHLTLIVNNPDLENKHS